MMSIRLFSSRRYCRCLHCRCPAKANFIPCSLRRLLPLLFLIVVVVVATTVVLAVQWWWRSRWCGSWLEPSQEVQQHALKNFCLKLFGLGRYWDNWNTTGGGYRALYGNCGGYHVGLLTPSEGLKLCST